MTMQRTPLLMARLIEHGAKLCPEEDIVTQTSNGVQRQNYRQTRDRAHQLAHAIKAAGIQTGDTIATFMWNNARHLEVYYATAGMGVILHTLNIRLGATDLEYIINHAQDQLIITDADLLPLLNKLQGRIPSVKQIIVASEAGIEDCQTTLPEPVDYEAFIANQPTQFDWPDIDENAPLGLCYTSGTTGQPKGVLYEHRAQYLHTLAISMTDVMNLSATDSMCGIVPMFHAMGWGLPWAGLMLGMKQVMPHRFMQAPQLLELIASEEVTISAGVPTIWQSAKAELQANPGKYDLSRLKRLTCGGSAPPKSLSRWYWENLGVEMIQGWGMTETSPLVTIARKVGKRSHLKLSDEEQFDNIGKTGLCIAGIDMEIFDESFKPLPHDGETPGEVLLRGPWISAGYYKNPQPDKFHNGWLITGDVAKMDSEEYLIITDRSKDLVKSGGEWISSVDLENHIVALDGVAQACVVAQPHPKWDERPVALVVKQPDSEVDAEQIQAHCAKQFAKWQLPDDVLFVNSIPLTSTGKMDKKTVRANLQQQGYQLPDVIRK